MEEFGVFIIKTYFTISLFSVFQIVSLCIYCSFLVCTFQLNLFGAATYSSLGHGAEQSQDAQTIFPLDKTK